MAHEDYDPEAKWYVVHTYSGYENKVKANLDKIVENRNLQDKILGYLKSSKERGRHGLCLKKLKI